MTPLMKAVVFCFCPEILPNTEGVHVSRTKQEEVAALMSFALYACAAPLIPHGTAGPAQGRHASGHACCT